MKTIETQDTVIVSHQSDTKFAGQIGFVIEVRNDNEQKERRFDVQFPYDSNQSNYRFANNIIHEQGQFGVNDLTIIQKYVR